jgi:hypothetical protein
MRVIMKPVVLFVSQRDNARSILAKTIIDRLGQGRFEAMSCGITPENRVYEPMRKQCVPIMKEGFVHKPQSLTEAMSKGPITHIITLGVDRDILKGFGIEADDERLSAHFALKDPQIGDLRPSEVSSLCHDLFLHMTELIQKWVLYQEALESGQLETKAA